jgi:hypothetical protein
MVELAIGHLLDTRRMPWHCPACGIAIDHVEFFPHTARTYHCTICHLELRFDPERNELTLAPMTESADRAATAIAGIERRAARVDDRRQWPRGGRRASDRHRS